MLIIYSYIFTNVLNILENMVLNDISTKITPMISYMRFYLLIPTLAHPYFISSLKTSELKCFGAILYSNNYLT